MNLRLTDGWLVDDHHASTPSFMLFIIARRSEPTLRCMVFFFTISILYDILNHSVYNLGALDPLVFIFSMVVYRHNALHFVI
jgi:hypothetical protein